VGGSCSCSCSCSCSFSCAHPHVAWLVPTGFLIADGRSGPFRLEIGGVSAISKITGRAPDRSLSDREGDGLMVEEEAGGEGKKIEKQKK
jgi:hypothetical protein